MAFDLDKESSFQDAMMGSAIGSIAHLNEGNLMLIKAFTDEVCEPIKNQTLLDAFHNTVNNWFEKSKLTN